MLIKLLKYDLKYMIKNMCVFYILSIFFAVLTRLLTNLEQSVIINIIKGITNGCLIAMMANILINTTMRSWVRFKDSIYKDEGYLTNTLPVSKSNIYNSKLIQALIFSLVGFNIILISLFIAYYSKETLLNISNYIKNLSTGFNMSTISFIIIVILLIFLELFNAIQCGFLGIIIGHKKNNGKTGLSVLFGFVSYFIAQNLVLLLMFIYGLFDSSIMELFKTSTVSIDMNAFKTLGIMSSILYLIIIFIMSLISKKILNEGINIE